MISQPPDVVSVLRSAEVFLEMIEDYLSEIELSGLTSDVIESESALSEEEQLLPYASVLYPALVDGLED
jgi:hypothetical protein